jgi:hypothetical protein
MCGSYSGSCEAMDRCNLQIHCLAPCTAQLYTCYFCCRPDLTDAANDSRPDVLFRCRYLQ